MFRKDDIFNKRAEEMGALGMAEDEQERRPRKPLSTACAPSLLPRGTSRLSALQD